MGQLLRSFSVAFVARMSGAISGAVVDADTVFPDIAPLIRATGFSDALATSRRNMKKPAGISPAGQW